MTPEALAYCEKQAQRIAELEAEVAALWVDAERYRWLRDNDTLERGVVIFFKRDCDPRLLPPEEIDAAIDAARGVK